MEDNGNLNQENNNQPNLEVFSTEPVPEPIVNSTEPIVNSTEPIVNSTEPVVNSTIDNNQSNVLYDSSMEKKPKGKILLIIGAIVLVAGIGIGAFLLISGMKTASAKETFTLSLNKQISQFNQFMKKADQINVAKSIVKEKGTMKLHFEVDSNDEMLKMLSGYKFDVTTGVNFKNNEVAAALNVSDKNNNKFDVSLFLDEKYQYIDLKDTYNKILKSEIVEFFNLKTILDGDLINVEGTDLNFDDFSYLMEKMIDVSIKATDEKDFSKEKITKTIFGNELKLIKTSYVLTPERLFKILKAYSEFLLEDEKALKIISDFSNGSLTVEDLRKETQKTLDDMKDMEKEKEFYDSLDVEEFEDITFTIYTTPKHELISTEMSNKSFNFSFTGVDKKFSLNFANLNDKTSLMLSFGEKDKDTLAIDLVSEELNLNGTIKIVDKSTTNTAAADMDFDLKFKTNFVQNDFDIWDDSEFDDQKSDTSDFDDWDFDGWGFNNFTDGFKKLATGDEYTSLKMKINYSFDDTFNFKKPDSANTIEIDNMTKEEYTDFSNSLEKNKLLKDSGILDLMGVLDYQEEVPFDYDDDYYPTDYDFDIY